jgi:uncharacterized protein (DUF58 family)
MSAAAVSKFMAIGPRFDRWLLDRVRRLRGPTELPQTLEYRYIYVLPTDFGLWFGLLLALMVIGGLNFNNNMTLLITFLLGSISILTMLLAYRNLAGLVVSGVLSQPAFLGESACFDVLLKNPDQRHRFALQVRGADSVDCADIEPENTRRLQVGQPTVRRGWMEMQPFRIENRFPLGLFRAWSLIIPRAQCLVYPKPASNPPPLPRTGRGDHGAARKGEGDHFHGLREYREGDPLRRIAWRTSARQQKLYSREMEVPSEESCELNWYLMGERDPEARLSVLTAWILRAERQQIPYSLELPGAGLPADLGADHRDACLEILALFTVSPPARLSADEPPSSVDARP